MNGVLRIIITELQIAQKILRAVVLLKTIEMQ